MRVRRWCWTFAWLLWVTSTFWCSRNDRTEISRVQRMRNDFVANVSHELKTPVGAVSLLAEAIEQAR